MARNLMLALVVPLLSSLEANLDNIKTTFSVNSLIYFGITFSSAIYVQTFHFAFISNVC